MTTTPTFEHWLQTRSEFVPDELRERIRFLVRDVLEYPIGQTSSSSVYQPADNLAEPPTESFGEASTESAAADLQSSLVGALADIAKTQLDALLQTGVTSRSVALDLLAIDAIATYALELAASTRTDMSVSATTVMQTITSLMKSRELNHS